MGIHMRQKPKNMYEAKEYRSGNARVTRLGYERSNLNECWRGGCIHRVHAVRISIDHFSYYSVWCDLVPSSRSQFTPV
jgi:hypothetical protein